MSPRTSIVLIGNVMALLLAGVAYGPRVLAASSSSMPSSSSSTRSAYARPSWWWRQSSSASSRSSLSSSRSSTGSSLSSAISSARSSRPAPRTRAEELAWCMSDQAWKRESSILTALDGYHRFLGDALRMRRDLITRAWETTDQRKRKTMLRTTWGAFGTAWRQYGQEFVKARKNVWLQYRLDILRCSTTAQDEEAGGYALDLQY